MTERRPVCFPCKQEMKCHKNEIEIVFTPDTIPAYYSGDLYICPNCGTTVLTGFGTRYDNPYNPVQIEIESKV